MENTKMIRVKLRRKIFEILTTLVIVMIRCSNPLVSIDKNDKLDLLIVENLSIISNKDFKDDSANHKDTGEQLCAIKELLVSNNIIIQKLCELDAKLEGSKQHTKTSQDSRLRNISRFDSAEEREEPFERRYNERYASAVVSQCKDKKKGQGKESYLDVTDSKGHQTRLDHKMRTFRMDKDAILSDNLKNREKNLNTERQRAASRQMYLDEEEALGDSEEEETLLTINREEERPRNLAPYLHGHKSLATPKLKNFVIS